MTVLQRYGLSRYVSRADDVSGEVVNIIKHIEPSLCVRPGDVGIASTNGIISFVKRQASRSIFRHTDGLALCRKDAKNGFSGAENAETGLENAKNKTVICDQFHVFTLLPRTIFFYMMKKSRCREERKKRGGGRGRQRWRRTLRVYGLFTIRER